MLLVLIAGCNNPASKKSQKDQTVNESYQPGTFGYDLEFLSKYQKTLVLKRGQAMMAVVPAYQGRVMTSAASGPEGPSFGWINYKLIESGQKVPHFNNFGGEERFWLGPEGGQFSIYFPPGVPFEFENWQVPAPIDSDPFDLVSANDTLAVFRKDISLVNYSNFRFLMQVDRSVSLLDPARIKAKTGIDLPDGIAAVAYESANKITNTGKMPWARATGLLSIWMLGQLISSPANIVLVPFVEGPESELGPIVNDNYFGKVPSERLKILENLILFKADGQQRGKIGLGPKRAKNFLGSYDCDQRILTILYFTKPEHYEGYVNSMWEIQQNPYSGDIINSYNDGPLEDGTQMGPFYELEASSPATSLKPGESMEQLNLTIHLSGDEAGMDVLLKSVFGITISEIMQEFPR